MFELASQQPESGTTTSNDEDALTKLFGRHKPGRCLAYGRGVTGTKLAILRERDDHFARLEGEQLVMKNQMQEMMNILQNIVKNPSAPVSIYYFIIFTYFH